MGKKYIIEIPDDKIADFVGSTHFIMPYIMEGHIGHHDTGLPIEPYTEPNIERVKKTAHDDGYSEGYQAGREDLNQVMSQVKKDYDAFYENGYQRGLSDAWEACRKIVCYEIDGGYPVGHMLNLFEHDDLPKILSDYTAAEAIEKLKAYKQEQEAEIKVGDEVEWMGDKYVVTFVRYNAKKADLISCAFGNACENVAFSAFVKTGRHFPEIAAVLEKMRKEQE